MASLKQLPNYYSGGVCVSIVLLTCTSGDKYLSPAKKSNTFLKFTTCSEFSPCQSVVFDIFITSCDWSKPYENTEICVKMFIKLEEGYIKTRFLISQLLNFDSHQRQHLLVVK